MSTHPVDRLLPNSSLQTLKALLEAPRTNFNHQGEVPPAVTVDASGSPYEEEREQICSKCSGSGIDVGGLKEYEPEDCRVCKGSGKELVTRRFLSEAFAIAAEQSSMVPERAHIKALVAHCAAVTHEYALLKAREA